MLYMSGLMALIYIPPLHGISFHWNGDKAGEGMKSNEKAGRGGNEKLKSDSNNSRRSKSESRWIHGQKDWLVITVIIIIVIIIRAVKNMHEK